MSAITVLPPEPAPAPAASYDTEIARLSPEFRAALVEFRTHTTAIVAQGAQLGAMIHEAQRRHKQDFWTWYRSLDPHALENDIRIALKAYHHRERNPGLNDPSQLTFALASGDETGNADEAQRQDQARKDNLMVEITGLMNRLTATINRLSKSPIHSWDPAVRRSLKEQARPIIELYGKL